MRKKLNTVCSNIPKRPQIEINQPGYSRTKNMPVSVHADAVQDQPLVAALDKILSL